MSGFNGGAALQELFGLIRAGSVDVYNEVSLQLELAFFLRTNFPRDLVVELERPAYHYGATRKLIKSEIDIAVACRAGSERRWAIELKFPRNGQYPEQMFSACKDLQFLEELCGAGFDAGWFAMLVDAAPFYNDALPATGIYQYFRGGVPIHGTIQKPTGAKDQVVQLRGSYPVRWAECGKGRRFVVVEVRG